MRKFAGDIGTRDLLVLFAKLLLAGAAMGGVCTAANRFFFMDPAHLPFWLRAGGLAATAGLAAVLYFAVARLLKVEEAGDALEMIHRRLKR
jgi:hypothetical protein